MAGAARNRAYIGLSDVGDLLLRLGRWPAMYLILTIALAVIYRYGPSREAPQWRWITWGSATAALLWLAISGLFSWYAANFGKFNETYGSLGAAIGFIDMALDLGDRDPPRGRAQCRDGTPDHPRHHHGGSKTYGYARRQDGGHRGSGPVMKEGAGAWSERRKGRQDTQVSRDRRQA